MPMLSAARNTTHPQDVALRPVTTFRNDVRDYALFFHAPDDYLGGGYVFDQLEEFENLLPETFVDRNFLISRYERLFMHKGLQANYYCVPWMGVPCSLVGTMLSPDESHLVVSVSSPELLGMVQGKRTLRLIPPAGTGITATWHSKKNASGAKDLLDIDLETFPGENVDLYIPNGQGGPGGAYGPAGVSIEIQDVTDGDKVVGKLRILFLEGIACNATIIQVKTDATDVRLSGMLPSDVPLSIESQGPSASYDNNPIINDVNLYGLGQLGILVNIGGNAEMIDRNGNPMFTTGAPALTIKKSKVGATDDHITEAGWNKLCEFVNSEWGHVRKGTAKYPKQCLTPILFTPFIYGDASEENGGALGVTKFELEVPDPSTADLTGNTTKQGAYFEILPTPPVIALLESFRVIVKGSDLWIDEPNASIGPIHSFRTLSHELGHAHNLSHYFGEKQKILFGRATYLALADAHKWLRLFFLGQYINNIYLRFKKKKVLPSHLATGNIINGGDETIFDQIISVGIEKAVTDHLDKIFGANLRPPSWSKATADSIAIGELTLWNALNDIVGYELDDVTSNLMDDGLPELDFKPSGSGSSRELYIIQKRMVTNRIQWEVMRKSVSLRNSIQPLV